MSTTQIKNGFHGGTDDQLLVNPNGSINVNAIGGGGGTTNANIVGLGMFQTSQYAIGVTAVQLAPTALPNRSSLSVTVEAAPNVAVYIGNSSSVTISTGYPLYDGSTLQLDLTPAGSIWAITATAGQTIAVLEIA